MSKISSRVGIRMTGKVAVLSEVMEFSAGHVKFQLTRRQSEMWIWTEGDMSGMEK